MPVKNVFFEITYVLMSIQVWNGFHFWGLSPNQIHLTNLQHIFANICINTCEKITNDKSNTRRQYYRKPPTNWYVREQIGSLNMQRLWRKPTQIDKVWSLHLKRNIQINVNMSQRHGPLIRVNHKNPPPCQKSKTRRITAGWESLYQFLIVLNV